MMSNPMRVLIGCELSGMVRRAFAALGHDAWSCDINPSEDGSNRHIIGDVRDPETANAQCDARPTKPNCDEATAAQVRNADKAAK